LRWSRIGPRTRSPTARLIARPTAGGSGMRASLVPLPSTRSTRWPCSSPRSSMLAPHASKIRSPSRPSIATEAKSNGFGEVRSTNTIPGEAQILLDEFTAYGTAATVQEQLERWDAVVDVTMVALPPGPAVAPDRGHDPRRRAAGVSWLTEHARYAVGPRPHSSSVVSGGPPRPSRTGRMNESRCPRSVVQDG
jgi:hypothetical protein